jgi:glycine/D-amino acid oxidase-like deaminating enzyme
MPITSTWSGLRPCSEDKLPVVGPSHVKGLCFATGHYRNGILLAPITAELIADLITSNFLSPLLSRFTPNRFDLVGAV